MNIHLIRRLRNFFITTLLGGVAAILPLALTIVFFRWIILLIRKWLQPVAELFETESVLQLTIVYILTIMALLFVFFLVGLIIKTRLGKFFNKVLEEKYLLKIPGYKIAKETVIQFFGKNKSFFREVVLVDPFNSGTLMTGFITDKHSDYITVFVPTGPNPTSGNIYHLPKEKVIFTTTPIDSGMKSIISCGAGSEEVFRRAKTMDSKKPNHLNK